MLFFRFLLLLKIHGSNLSILAYTIDKYVVWRREKKILTRKWTLYAVIIYLLYIASMYSYLFFFADTSIPDALKGTAADPQTFLNARELVLSEKYSTIRNFIFFINTPLEWLIYFFILIFGISRGFEKWSLSISKWRFVQTGIYLFCLSLLTYVAVFPIKYVSYKLSKSYHINIQTFNAWLKDEVISFWVDFGLMFLIVTVLYWLIKKVRENGGYMHGFCLFRFHYF